MNLNNPFDVFILAVFAGAGWALGVSLVQSMANQVNLYLVGRTTKRHSEAALGRMKEGVARMEQANAELEKTAKAAGEQPAAAGREIFPVLGEVGRS